MKRRILYFILPFVAIFTFFKIVHFIARSGSMFLDSVSQGLEDSLEDINFCLSYSPPCPPPTTVHGELDVSRMSYFSILELFNEVSSKFHKYQLPQENYITNWLGWIYTTGRIVDISKKNGRNATYFVCIEDDGLKLDCIISCEDSNISHLRKGDKITLCGTFVRGFRDRNENGLLANCTVIKKLEK